ncbi:MAG: FAD-binding protein [Bacilli bacterium]|nr:FAD-binding protein [Bacilli bacterium]
MNNFLDKIKGPIINCNNSSYNKLRKIWNNAIDKYPFLIIYPIDENDVINTINYVIKNNMVFRIRNGGYCYAGFSVLNNGIVIDLSYLNKVIIDEMNNIVHVYGGSKNEDLAKELARNNYQFIGGECAKVGVSGYILGGGWNYYARSNGLGCDSLKEIEMINYQGKKILANAVINKDLFWAVKGAGQNNFGVITKMSFNLPSKVKEVTLLEITSDNLNIDEQYKLFKLWQDIVLEFPNYITTKIEFRNSDDEVKVYFQAVINSKDNTETLFHSFQQIKALKLNYIVDSSYNITNRLFSKAPLSETMQDIGLYVTKNYNENEIMTILNLVNNKKLKNTISSLTLYAMGGAIRNYNTSFYDRNAKYILSFKMVYNDNKEKVNTYMHNCYQILKPLTTGAYINNPYLLLDDYEKAYFGQNIVLLRKIKQKYDPYNYFRYEQSLKLN